MRLTTIILGVVVAMLVSSALTLQKNESEVHKFLIDQGKVSKNSTIESFMIDRFGIAKIAILDGEYHFTYGLQENGNTFEIVKMKKRKQSEMFKPKVLPDQKLTLAQKIGASLTILKGGKVIEIRRVNGGKKSDVEVEYKVGAKTYTISGVYESKTGDFSIRGVQEGAHRYNTEM